jgi:hypothetical protein
MKTNLTLDIPRQLALLCSLLEITPERLLQSFIDDLTRTLQSNGSDERILAAAYFLRCGYGIHCFDYGQIETMLTELDCIRYERYQFDNEKEAEYRKHLQKRLKEWYTRWHKVKKIQSLRDEGQ